MGDKISKHTPAPWVVEGDGITVREAKKPGAQKICRAFEVCMDREERLANAKLIASAPELKEALNAILGLTDDKNILSIVREAIAKAEGR